MHKRIVILGATGNTGRPVVEQLLQDGHTVVAIGRDSAKLSDLKSKGAEIAVGDLKDTAFLTQTLRGADAAYVLIPPSMQEPDFAAYQDLVGQSIAKAIEDSGVRRVVHLSSQGADLPAKNGPVAGLYRQEARLNLIPGIHVVHLRPSYFLENLFMFLGQVPTGTIASHLALDSTTPLIATRDIAAVAARYLTELSFTGRSVHDLLGAADYSFAHVLQAFRTHLGVPELQWMVISDEAQLAGMIQFGLPADLAGMYVELGHSVNEGIFAHHPPRTAAFTTPTSLDTFVAQVMAPAARAQA